MLLTLLTDFGTRDYYVGAMKGVILSRVPDLNIVDLTHEIPPQDVSAGAFVLYALHREFPERTVHVAVVDPGVGSSRRVLVVRAAGQYFVGPDNGLFSYILDTSPDAVVWEVHSDKHHRKPVSRTFHGRDIFAPLGAALASGEDPETVGRRVTDAKRLRSLEVEPGSDGGVTGRIIHIDTFGNCVTNITADDLAGSISAEAPVIVGSQKIERMYDSFSDGAPGELFAIWGSAGFLELSVNLGSAADALRVERGDELTVPAR